MNPLSTLRTVFALACLAPSLPAADYYLSASQGVNDNWYTTPSVYWKANPDGSGAGAPSISSGNNYYVNGFTLRTASNLFAGNLFLNGGTILLKDSTTGTSSVTNLTLDGGTIGNGQAYIDDFEITNLLNNSGTTTISTGGSNRGVLLIVGTLSGSGNFNITGANGQSQWAVSSAASYTGTIGLTSGRLNFNADFYAPLASISIEATSTKFTLDQTITVGSLIIDGTPLAADTYSYAQLNALFGTIFDSGTGAGSITVVPEPSTYALVGAGVVLLYFLRRTKIEASPKASRA